MNDRTIENYKVNNLNIDLWYDWDIDGPDTWGNYRIVQFRDNDYTTYEQFGYSEYVTENQHLTPAILAKLRAGKMFTIDYRSYSNADGGYYSLNGDMPKGEVDSQDVNGFIIFDDDYIKGTSYEERKKYAEQDLKEYTAWANGEVYGFTVTDHNGDVIDSCGGFIGDIDYCKEEAESMACNTRSSITACNAQALHN